MKSLLLSRVRSPKPSTGKHQKLAQCLLLLTLCCSAQAGTEPVIDPALRLRLEQAINASDSFPDRFEAEVWLLDMSNRLSRWVSDPKKRLEILRHVHYEATKAELTPSVVLAVMEVESAFDRFAISSAGARGLMQIMPFWIKEIGKEEDSLFHVKTNVRYGCTILKYYLDKEKGDLTEALARYNGSKGRYVYPKKVFTAFNRHWTTY